MNKGFCRFYPKASDGLFDGSFSSGNFKCSLLTPLYEYDVSHEFFTDINSFEIVADGYGVGGNPVQIQVLPKSQSVEFVPEGVSWDLLSIGGFMYAVYYNVESTRLFFIIKLSLDPISVENKKVTILTPQIPPKILF